MEPATGFRQVITADKEGFLEYLDVLIASHLEMQKAAQTTLAVRYESGVMDGLRIARRAVESWQQEAES